MSKLDINHREDILGEIDYACIDLSNDFHIHVHKPHNNLGECFLSAHTKKGSFINEFGNKVDLLIMRTDNADEAITVLNSMLLYLRQNKTYFAVCQTYMHADVGDVYMFVPADIADYEGDMLEVVRIS